MKKSNLLRLFFGTLLTVTATAFVGCVDSNEDNGAPALAVSPASTLAFNADGDSSDEFNGVFAVKTNRPWKATVEAGQEWVTLSAYEGNGDANVSVFVPASTVGRTAKVTFEIFNSYGPLKTVVVNVAQGEIKPVEVIYNENFGTKGDKVGTSYPFVDQYTDWQKKGTGASTVTYTGVAASLRTPTMASGSYDGASGSTALFFGAASSFVVNKITMPNATGLSLTFGGTYYNFDIQDNVFVPDNFHVYLSANGTDWTEIKYSISELNDKKWVFASFAFTLKNAVSELYIKFAPETPIGDSKFRIDDVTLSTGNGGTEVDLGAGGGAGGSLTVSPTSVHLDSANASVATVNITASEDWTIATTGAGFTVAPMNGTGNGTITITASAANTTDASKDLGSVVVSTVSSGSKSVTVSQKGVGSSSSAITIPELIAKMPNSMTTAEILDADYDRELTGIVMNDVVGGNYSNNNLILATKGATTAGNGIVVYGSIAEPSSTTNNLAKGDEVKITLYKGLAKYQNYSGLYEITGDKTATYLKIEKISSGNAITPVVITPSQMTSFQSMAVTIKGVASSGAGSWATASAAGPTAGVTFTANSTAFTVYCKGGSAAFADKTFVATTADMTGIVALYKGNAQLCPRNMDDVSGFNGAAPTTPTITGVTPTSYEFPAAGETKDFVCTVANQGSETLSVSGLTAPFSATVSGTTVKITATENTATTAVAAQTATIALSNGNSVTVSVSQAAKGAAGGDTYTLVTKLADLTAGTYYMAGLAGGNYNIWAGTLDYNKCVTYPYTYNATTKTLTANDAANDKAVAVTLVAVAGVDNAFYIKVGTQYLTVKAAGKNQLILADVETNNYWTLANLDDNGVKGIAKAFDSMMCVSTSATSTYIRSYVSTNTTGIGGISFFKKN